MKKILLIVLLAFSLFANEKLGTEVIDKYGEVTYICKDGNVVALVVMDHIIREVPIVWEQPNGIVKVPCDKFKEWSK